MAEALVGLGSNLGDRPANLAEALRRIDEVDGLAVLRVSRAVESAPWGVEDQPPFANAVAVVRSELGADVLLEWLLGIEDEMGRDRGAPRNGPRIIDLDLLLFGDEEWAPRDPASGLPDPTRLTLPHPRMLEREFVMRPLLEVAPDAVLPDGRRLADLFGSATQGRVTGDLGAVGEWASGPPPSASEPLPGESETEYAERMAMLAPAPFDVEPLAEGDEWVPLLGAMQGLLMAFGGGMDLLLKQNALLEAGIPAQVDPPPIFASPGMPHFAIMQPIRLMVPASRLAEARAVLAETELPADVSRAAAEEIAECAAEGADEGPKADGPGPAPGADDFWSRG